MFLDFNPIDAALDHRSKLLYVLVTGIDAVITCRVGLKGALTQIDFDDTVVFSNYNYTQ